MARTLPIGDGTGRSANEIAEDNARQARADREARVAETERQLREATDAIAARLAAGEVIPGVNG